jgi:hypothetical protein
MHLTRAGLSDQVAKARDEVGNQEPGARIARRVFRIDIPRDDVLGLR